jgi:hypothetical protein
MKFGSRLERCASALLVIGIGVLVSGTKACQEDYNFADQANVPGGTGTPASTLTATASATPSVTPTGSITPTVNGTNTPTPVGTDDPADDGEDTQEAGGGDDLFNELSALSESKSGGRAGGAAKPDAASSKGQNWLGAAFSKDPEGSWRDGDGDGYSDAFEEEYQSEPQNAASAPKLETSTRLEDRIRQQEVEQQADRLGDEARVGEGEDAPVDSDVDGVPDDIEEQRGLNPQSIDSDQDGLRDDRELVLGSNPLSVDSDGDGISDVREYALGSDPTIPEPK